MRQETVTAPLFYVVVSEGLNINRGGQGSGAFAASARWVDAPLLTGQDQTRQAAAVSKPSFLRHNTSCCPYGLCIAASCCRVQLKQQWLTSGRVYSEGHIICAVVTGDLSTETCFNRPFLQQTF